MSGKKSKNSYLFIDLKANGYRPTVDRITEIAIYQLDEQGKEKIWHQSIFSESFSSDSLLIDKTNSFREIAPILAAAFENRILVSTQGRIKYALLKNEMKRAGVEWTAKVLCINQLLKFLAQENNDETIKRNFSSSDCLITNVKAIARKFDKLNKIIDEMQLDRVIKQQIKRSAIPLQLAQTIDAIPELNGVYQFYSETGALLYVGKSTSLRQRVMSHFSGDYSNNREMQLTQQTKAITWIKACGEFGALLKEAQLIKSNKPIFNRLLRRYRDLFSFQIYQNKQQYNCLEIVSSNKSVALGLEKSFGLFKRKSIAKQKLQEITRKYQLCPKLMGLETGKGACFLYHVQRCLGACIGKEPLNSYNQRVHQALQIFNYKAWPFSSEIIIKETCPVTGDSDYHLIDNWCYLATFHGEQQIKKFKLLANDLPFEIYEVTDVSEENKIDFNIKPIFDLDIYKILTTFILKRKNIVRSSE